MDWATAAVGERFSETQFTAGGEQMVVEYEVVEVRDGVVIARQLEFN